MRYLFAIVLPPLAVLVYGGFWTAVLNFILCCCLYFPGMIHAILVVQKKTADERQAQMMGAMQEQSRIQMAQLQQQQMMQAQMMQQQQQNMMCQQGIMISDTEESCLEIK